MDAFRGWDIILGLQFENLVLESLGALLGKTGLTQVTILNAGPYVQTQTQRRRGCQIDLLVRTKQSLYIFEIKFRHKIEKDVIGEVREKVECLNVPRAVSVRTGLIYQGELVPEVPESDYFDFLVPFDDLLEGADGRA